MITGRLPFPNPSSLFKYVTSKEAFPAITSMGSDCAEFVQITMDVSPRKRPTAEQALESSWIQTTLSQLSDSGSEEANEEEITPPPSLREQGSLPIPAASIGWTTGLLSSTTDKSSTK
jgi:serine/threonine protein kinase